MRRLFICLGAYLILWPLGVSHAQDMKSGGDVSVTLSNSIFMFEQGKEGLSIRGEPHTRFHVKGGNGFGEQVDTDARGRLPLDLRRYAAYTIPGQTKKNSISLLIDY